MGGSSGPQQSTTQVKLPNWLNTQLKGAGGQIGAAGQGLESKAFPGPFVATRTPYDEQALGLGQGFIQGQQGIGAGVNKYGMDLLGGKYLDFAKTPEYQNFLQAGIYDPMNANIRDVLLPATMSRGIEGGAFGGSRNAVAETLAYRDANRAAAEAAAKAGLATRAMERGFMQQAPQLLQTGAQLSALPSEASAKLGEYERQLQELQIGQNKAAFEEQYLSPFRGQTAWLNALAPLIGAYGGGTTTKIEGGGGPGQGASAIMGGLGGAATGAALGSAIAPGAGTLIGGLAGAGGLLGGLGGFFG